MARATWPARAPRPGDQRNAHAMRRGFGQGLGQAAQRELGRAVRAAPAHRPRHRSPNTCLALARRRGSALSRSWRRRRRYRNQRRADSDPAAPRGAQAALFTTTSRPPRRHADRRHDTCPPRAAQAARISQLHGAEDADRNPRARVRTADPAAPRGAGGVVHHVRPPRRMRRTSTALRSSPRSTASGRRPSSAGRASRASTSREVAATRSALLAGALTSPIPIPRRPRSQTRFSGFHAHPFPRTRRGPDGAAMERTRRAAYSLLAGNLPNHCNPAKGFSPAALCPASKAGAPPAPARPRPARAPLQQPRTATARP